MEKESDLGDIKFYSVWTMGRITTVTSHSKASNYFNER